MNAKRENVLSRLLSAEENSMVTSAVGQDVDVVSIGVVQLLKPVRSGWTKVLIGVACFVKDWSKKGYFIRVVDVDSATVVLDEELYGEIVYQTPEPKFQMFEGETNVVGLQFADADEADHFENAVRERISKRHRRRRTAASKKQEMKQKSAVGVGLGVGFGVAEPGKGSLPNESSDKKKRNSKKTSGSSWFKLQGISVTQKDPVSKKVDDKRLDLDENDPNNLEAQLDLGFITYDDDNSYDQDLTAAPATKVYPKPESSMLSLQARAPPMTLRRPPPMVSEDLTREGNPCPTPPRGDNKYPDEPPPPVRRPPPSVPSEDSSGSAAHRLPPPLPSKAGVGAGISKPPPLTPISEENYRNVQPPGRTTRITSRHQALRDNSPSPVPVVESSSAEGCTAPPPLPSKPGLGLSSRASPVSAVQTSDDNVHSTFRVPPIKLKPSTQPDDSPPPIVRGNRTSSTVPLEQPARPAKTGFNAKPRLAPVVPESTLRGIQKGQSDLDDESPPPTVPRDKRPRDPSAPPGLPSKLSTPKLFGSGSNLAEEEDYEYDNVVKLARNDRPNLRSPFSSRLNLAPSKLPSSKSGSSESINDPTAKPGLAPKPSWMKPGEPHPVNEIPSISGRPESSQGAQSRVVQGNKLTSKLLSEAQESESSPGPGPRLGESPKGLPNLAGISPKPPLKGLKPQESTLNTRPTKASDVELSKNQAQTPIQLLVAKLANGKKGSETTDELPSRPDKSSVTLGNGKGSTGRTAGALKASEFAGSTSSLNKKMPSFAPSISQPKSEAHALEKGPKPVQPFVQSKSEDSPCFVAPSKQPSGHTRPPPRPPTVPAPDTSGQPPPPPPPPPPGLPSQRIETSTTPSPPTSDRGRPGSVASSGSGGVNGKGDLLEQIRQIGGFKGASLRPISLSEGRQFNQPKDSDNALTSVLLGALNIIQKANNSSDDEECSDDDASGYDSADSWD